MWVSMYDTLKVILHLTHILFTSDRYPFAKTLLEGFGKRIRVQYRVSSMSAGLYLRAPGSQGLERERASVNAR